MSTQLREPETMVASPVDSPPNARVAAAYRVCEGIARREARNFYYAFRALPKPKRNAICAVYAFMRHADDLSDDESLPHQQRRAALDEWLAAWHEADRAHVGGGIPGFNDRSSTPQPQFSKDSSVVAVFLALADARQRFNIPAKLLDELVQGTALDLDRSIARLVPTEPEGVGTGSVNTSVYAMQFDLYPTFEDLYHYCYLVASVVGLVCIRIFGYQDARAEKLAEETGIAFQLTNILRDVREDAERGRIYLPVEDMERLGVTPDELADIAAKQHPTLNQRELLSIEAQRAEHYYQSARALLPLIDADSRPALWVLVTIYHRLLERILRRNYDVFTQRVSVPTWEKIWILCQGLMRVLAYRLGRG